MTKRKASIQVNIKINYYKEKHWKILIYFFWRAGNYSRIFAQCGKFWTWRPWHTRDDCVQYDCVQYDCVQYDCLCLYNGHFSVQCQPVFLYSGDGRTDNSVAGLWPRLLGFEPDSRKKYKSEIFFSYFCFLQSVSFSHCSISISIFTATSKRSTNLRMLETLHQSDPSSEIEERQERKHFHGLRQA